MSTHHVFLDNKQFLAFLPQILATFESQCTMNDKSSYVSPMDACFFCVIFCSFLPHKCCFSFLSDCHIFRFSHVYFSHSLHRSYPLLSAAYALSLLLNQPTRKLIAHRIGIMTILLGICGSYVLPALHTCGRIVVAPPSPILFRRSGIQRKSGHVRVCVCVCGTGIRYDSILSCMVISTVTKHGFPIRICVP